jgi:hypothetical protein
MEGRFDKSEFHNLHYVYVVVKLLLCEARNHPCLYNLVMDGNIVKNACFNFELIGSSFRFAYKVFEIA